jgi:hypothetical protein
MRAEANHVHAEAFRCLTDSAGDVGAGNYFDLRADAMGFGCRRDECAQFRRVFLKMRGLG